MKQEIVENKCNLKYVSRPPRGGRYKTVSKIGNLIW